MIFRVLAIATLFLWFPSAFKRWTHGFRLSKCQIEWPYQPSWESSQPSSSIRKVLAGEFTYLNKGAQSYVFLSGDGEYVLKLFRFDNCRMPLGRRTVRAIRKWVALSEKHFLPLDARAKKTFTSCQLSQDLVPHLTGVIWTHLNPKPTDLPSLLIRDRLGRRHLVDPAKYRFVLQRRAEPFLATLLKVDDFAPYLDSYVALLNELSEWGLANLDRTMGKNFGFIEGKAVEIDFGNFSLNSTLARNDPVHFSKRLIRWLRKHRPEAADYLEARVKE